MLARILAVFVALALVGGVATVTASIDEAAQVADDGSVELASPPEVVALAPPIGAVVDVVHAEVLGLTPRLHVIGLFRPPQR